MASETCDDCGGLGTVPDPDFLEGIPCPNCCGDGAFCSRCRLPMSICECDPEDKCVKVDLKEDANE